MNKPKLAQAGESRIVSFDWAKLVALWTASAIESTKMTSPRKPAVLSARSNFGVAVPRNNTTDLTRRLTVLPHSPYFNFLSAPPAKRIIRDDFCVANASIALIEASATVAVVSLMYL